MTVSPLAMSAVGRSWVVSGSIVRITLHSILVGRDRITEVLNAHIAPRDALERANNIAQALVTGSRDPARVAFDMLRHLDIGDPCGVAAQVGEAWSSQTSTMDMLQP